MNLTELQIMFQQKIQDTNLVFESQERPESFAIENYLNKAIYTYLEKYTTARSYEERLIIIDQNLDELNELINRSRELTHIQNPTTLNWGTRAARYRLPDDCLVPVSLTANITRTEVFPMSGQKQFVQFVSRKQAERLVSDSMNKSIYPQPVAFFEDELYLMLVGDAYVTVITAGEFVYLRKPSVLSYNYNELSSDTSITLTAIANGSYFKSLTPLMYNGTLYPAGGKVQKVAGVNVATSYNSEPLKISYPWGNTDTPEFPASMHYKLVDIAVQHYLDEAKLKLIQKEPSKN